jgi:hypothetical protein
MFDRSTGRFVPQPHVDRRDDADDDRVPCDRCAVLVDPWDVFEGDDGNPLCEGCYGSLPARLATPGIGMDYRCRTCGDVVSRDGGPCRRCDEADDRP